MIKVTDNVEGDFSESLELNNFPFDSQDLNIRIKFNNFVNFV